MVRRIAGLPTVMVVLGCMGTAEAAVITTDSVSDFSSQLGDFNRNAVHVVDDSFDTDTGNNPDPGPGHTNLPGNTMWLTVVEGFGGVDNDPFITFDLGSVYELQGINVWNYNELDGFSERGVQSVDIYSSETGTPDTLQLTTTFAQAPGAAGYEGETILFDEPFAARYITFDIASNWANDFASGTGLSEVQFIEVPEPASLGMLAAGAVVLASGRRRPGA